MSCFRFLPVAIPLTIALLVPGPAAHAQIRRCATPTGEPVYTDRECTDIGAVENPRSATPVPVQMHDAPSQTACQRSLPDLLAALAAAIDMRDPARLVELYHWPGTDTRRGYAIVERLDAIARRPLIDVRPLFPTARPDVDAAPAAAASAAAAPGGLRSAGSEELRTGPSSAAHATTVAPRRPHAIALEQAADGGGRTLLSLHRHLGCWWVRL